jgi:DNA polymerase elongation subunit (family B)
MGIKVFFDIRVPHNKDVETFKIKILKLLADNKDDNGKIVDMENIRIKHIKAFPIRGYYKEKQPFLRIITKNTFQRKTALNIILNYNSKIRKEFAERKRSDLNDILETASDDESNYFRKVAREYRIPLSGWALLSNYNKGRKPYNTHSPICSHSFYMDINDYKPIEDPSILYKTYPSSAFTKDRTLVLAWDIETYSSRGPEYLPEAKYESDSIFMICMTVHWKDDPTPLKNICLVDVPTRSDPDWITIVCGNETNLLKAFALCWQAFTPDIELTFNGSKYDWLFVVQRATQLNILDWMFTKMSAYPRKKNTIDGILRWNYYGGVGEPFNNDGSFNKDFFPELKKIMPSIKNKNIKSRGPVEIKISADSSPFVSSFLKVPGCVPIDVLPAFKLLDPKAEKNSLNYFLSENDLGSKVDLDKNVMRNYYESAKQECSITSMKNMKVVVEYCIVDAKRCQQLMVKRNVINDYREVSSIAYVSLFDSHYYANGMKVCNLLGEEAWKRDILITMIRSNEKDPRSFPGAYVFPPIKGLENKRPVTGLDFASLYPSLIMTYNLSPEKIILSREEANTIKEVLHKIEFPSRDQTIHAWSVRHGNKTEKKGLYPSVLEKLGAKRNILKARLGNLGKTKERMGQVRTKIGQGLSLSDAINYVIKNTEEKKRPETADILLPLSTMSLKQFNAKYNKTTFEYECINAK